jgi:hypothetical protein
MSQVSELGSNLVMSSCFQIHLDQAQTPLRVVIQERKRKDGFPAAGSRRVQNTGRSSLDPFQVVHDPARRLSDLAFQDGQVCLPDRLGPELQAEAPGRLGCPAEKYDSCNGAVQTVDHSEKYIAGFCVSIL